MRPRSTKDYKPKPPLEVPPFPYLSFLELKPAKQTDLHPLWNVHLWVSESPSSCDSCLFWILWHAALSLHVVVQETMCHVTLGHGVPEAGAREGMHPSMAPCLWEWASNPVGPKPLVGAASSSPRNTPIHVGSKNQYSEDPSAQVTKSP